MKPKGRRRALSFGLRLASVQVQHHRQANGLGECQLDAHVYRQAQTFNGPNHVVSEPEQNNDCHADEMGIHRPVQQPVRQVSHECCALFCGQLVRNRLSLYLVQPRGVDTGAGQKFT